MFPTVNIKQRFYIGKQTYISIEKNGSILFSFILSHPHSTHNKKFSSIAPTDTFSIQKSFNLWFNSALPYIGVNTRLRTRGQNHIYLSFLSGAVGTLLAF